MDPAGEAVVMAAVAFDAQVRVGVAGDERGKALRTDAGGCFVKF